MSETIYVTIPCQDNGIKALDRTISNVTMQGGDFSIRLHVQAMGGAGHVLSRLAWWRRHLQTAKAARQCRGIDFSFAAQSDETVFGAIARGFAAMDIPADSFMTWVQPGDRLQPGSLAFIAEVARQMGPDQVSWVTGTPAAMRGEWPVSGSAVLAAYPTELLGEGLCDGMHLPELQAAGTFFRHGLWQSVRPEAGIGVAQHAGAWRLWQMFAGKAPVVQTSLCLGTRRADTPAGRTAKMAEIEAFLPVDMRHAALERLVTSEADLTCRMIETSDDALLRLVEEGCNKRVAAMIEATTGDPVALNDNATTRKVIAAGVSAVADVDSMLEGFVSFSDNIAAYDRDWQFPAITERQAFRQMRDAGGVPGNAVYVAYPWANLFDKIHRNASDAKLHLALFYAFCAQLPKDRVRVTVCQHPGMPQFTNLLEEAGIDHVFWSHAVAGDDRAHGAPGIKVHPFPLFPVQVPAPETQLPTGERPYLFSFVGTREHRPHASHTRKWVLDLLHDHPRGLIVGGDGTGGNAADLAGRPASEQSRMALTQAMFVLCPSDAGANPLRLWEALAARAIPVVLADSFAPPGDPALWDAGVVFCKENPEAIKALPERLAKRAADPLELEKMRRVCAQLRLLYGPHSFVLDVQKLMLRLSRERTAPQGNAAVPLRKTLAIRLGAAPKLTVQDAQLLLRLCAGDLLLDGADVLDELQSGNTLLGQMVKLAEDTLPSDNPTLQHYRETVAHVTRQAASPGLSAPAPTFGNGLRICFAGAHANRTPLGHPALRRALGNRIRIEPDPARADVVLTGCNADIPDNPDIFGFLAKERPDTRIMVISEEPLWDSLWSGDFSRSRHRVRSGDTEVGYTFLNHSNSELFAFRRVPYVLLTEDDLLARYGLLIRRNCALSPQELLARWQNAPIPAAFVAERREGEEFARSFPDQAVYGLSSYRSEVAAAAAAQGNSVHLEGKGWHTDGSRPDLPDWHLDKLASLDARVRVMSSFENTHQQHYISKRIFDAFVVGGIPACYADKNHSIHRLVPESCMINTFGQPPEEAAARIIGIKPGLEMAESWLETAMNLQALCTDTDVIAQERKRVAEAVLRAIEA